MPTEAVFGVLTLTKCKRCGWYLGVPERPHIKVPPCEPPMTLEEKLKRVADLEKETGCLGVSCHVEGDEMLPCEDLVDVVIHTLEVAKEILDNPNAASIISVEDLE